MEHLELNLLMHLTYIALLDHHIKALALQVALGRWNQKPAFAARQLSLPRWQSHVVNLQVK